MICLMFFLGTILLDSDRAKYDGTQIVLDGRVCVEHPIGNATSDTAIYEKEEEKLTLRGNVVVNLGGMGKLTTDGDLVIYKQQLEGSSQLKKIVTGGNTVFTYEDKSEPRRMHVLENRGTVVVDHENLITTMESPRDEEGKIIEGMQLYAHDEMGEIYADTLTIQYALLEKQIEAKLITLAGNVRMVNRSNGNEFIEEPLQYAIADLVEYTPQAKEMLLSANGSNRVLLFDKVNHLQVSAPKIKIRRDLTTDKQTIQGLGDVKFNFMQQEMEQFKKLFPKACEKGL